jgi:hypothetical protein
MNTAVFLNQSQYNSLPKNWKRAVFPTKNVVSGVILSPNNKYVYIPFIPFGAYKSPLGKTVGLRKNITKSIVNKATRAKINSAQKVISRSVKKYLYNPNRKKMNWVKKQRKSNVWIQ